MLIILFSQNEHIERAVRAAFTTTAPDATLLSTASAMTMIDYVGASNPSLLLLDIHPSPQEALRLLSRLYNDAPRVPQALISNQAARLDLQSLTALRTPLRGDDLARVARRGLRGLEPDARLRDLLMLHLLHRSSGSLYAVTRTLRGMVYLNDGLLVHAEAGGRSGVEALELLLSLPALHLSGLLSEPRPQQASVEVTLDMLAHQRWGDLARSAEGAHAPCYSSLSSANAQELADGRATSPAIPIVGDDPEIDLLDRAAFDPSVLEGRELELGEDDSTVDAALVTVDAPLEIDWDEVRDAPHLKPLPPPPPSGVAEALRLLTRQSGFVGGALVDTTRGALLGELGGGDVELSVAAEMNTRVVRAKLKTIELLGLKEGIEDILITLDRHLHLIRLSRLRPDLFFYLVLRRHDSNLALARLTLHKADELLGHPGAEITEGDVIQLFRAPA